MTPYRGPLFSDRWRLHCLRDRLTVDEAADLGDQFPELIRGIYYEAWHPAGKPLEIRSREEFLARLYTPLAPSPIDPEDAARVVFQALEQSAPVRSAM